MGGWAESKSGTPTTCSYKSLAMKEFLDCFLARPRCPARPRFCHWSDPPVAFRVPPACPPEWPPACLPKWPPACPPKCPPACCPPDLSPDHTDWIGTRAVGSKSAIGHRSQIDRIRFVIEGRGGWAPDPFRCGSLCCTYGRC